MVYELLDRGYDVDCVSFDYGQRHKKELIFARDIAVKLRLRHDVVDLSSITHLIDNSALTSLPPMQELLTDGDKLYPGRHINPYDVAVPSIEVPEGHYAQENMKQTVVPNRNMIMLSIAAGIAVNRNAIGLATGVHAGDHFIYPDCRPRFIALANATIVVGNDGFGPIEEGSSPEGQEPMHYIIAPFLDWTKADIAYRALIHGVPLHMTWSCYKGGANHCGRCGTCVERLEAIHEAQIKYTADKHLSALKDGIAPAVYDQTVYDDNEYWKVAIATAKETAK
jgi:7-cyano-7-deazaguanine synthase